jgi:hypothetical protein
VHVFVANKKEYDVYASTLDSSLYTAIHIGKKGLVQQREFICNMFPENQHIVFVDDDVESIDMSLSPMFSSNSLHSFFEKAFKECQDKQAFIWGVYPVFNPFYRSPRKEITYDLSYIVGALYGIINRPTNKALRLCLTRKDGQKEDVERSLKYFIHDNIVVRFNKIGFKTKYYGKEGGLGTFDSRVLPMRRASLSLKEAYPEYGDVVVRKSGITEFRLRKCKNISQQGK